MHRAYVGACAHMRFVAELYHEQIESNRYFLHEHPRYATSWKLDCTMQLENIPGVGVVRGDQCQYGAVVRTGKYKDRPSRNRRDSCRTPWRLFMPCLAYAKADTATAVDPKGAAT